MSRLSRLRSFWRSLRRGTVRDGSYRPHAAVNLLPQEYRDTGGLRTDGSWVLSASTDTKEHGTPILAMGITAGCSFSYPPGNLWTVASDQTFRLHASSFTARGWSTGGTA